MTTTVNGLAELKALAGSELGQTGWREITQERVNAFADATDDHQWIHVDPERAGAGPFGGTVAHGFLTLSLLIPLYSELLRVEGVRMGINYGVNKVRFPAPVRVGSQIRASGKLVSVDDVPDDGVQVVVDVTVEATGVEKPVCVAQLISRLYA